MDDLHLLDDLHRLVPKLMRVSRRERVAALRHLFNQLGDLDGVVVPHHADWHIDAIDMYGRALSRRIQLAAADDRAGIRRGALRAAREVRATLNAEVRSMELVAELDRLSDADAL